MPRTIRRRLAAGHTAVEQLQIDTFARNLDKHLKAKGWSASDLAAAIWGRKKDARGYDVAIGRDRISVYLAGKSYPDNKNLNLIAMALEVNAEDLAPDITAATVEAETTDAAMTQVGDKTLVQVRKLLTFDQAVRIMAIINEGHDRPDSTPVIQSQEQHT